MSARALMVSICTVGAAAFATTWIVDPSSRGITLLILIVGIGVVGLAGEVLRLWRPSKGGPPRSEFRDNRPADGVVEIAEMIGVDSEPNSIDSRYRRYRSLQPDRPREPRRPASHFSAPSMRGRIAIVSLFAGRDGVAWSDREIVDTCSSLLRAGRWLENEAMRWKVPVNLELADTYLQVDDHEADDVEIEFVCQGENGTTPTEAESERKAIVAFSRAAARLGFADAVDLTDRIAARLKADACVWMIHLRSVGCSFAIPSSASGLPGVASAVCYAREETLPGRLTGAPFADPVTFAHEMLHLFGAEDKYSLPLRAYPAGSVTDRDVMRLRFEKLSRLRVDPLTAEEIGWRDSK